LLLHFYTSYHGQALKHLQSLFLQNHTSTYVHRLKLDRVSYRESQSLLLNLSFYLDKIKVVHNHRLPYKKISPSFSPPSKLTALIIAKYFQAVNVLLHMNLYKGSLLHRSTLQKSCQIILVVSALFYDITPRKTLQFMKVFACEVIQKLYFVNL